ncbi:hypothetical protein [Actinoplanes sp. NPDC048796]|uniref:hypothetical protein n=1 Tax=Actinoplanes sp. NPDC048796 TaxID=3155640 RepID=UPI0033F65C8E
MTVTDEWRAALVDGFSVLLGRPVDDDAAEYAVYYVCDDLADDLFAKGFDAGVLTEVVRPPFSSVPVLGKLLAEWDLIAPFWSLDLGRSRFRAAVEGDGADAGVPELDAGVTGAELGRILGERGLEPRDIRDAYPEVEFRVDTDGSLAGALAAATGAMRGPEHLFTLSPDWGVDPVWDGRLAAVRHPGLRDHLRHLCRTKDSARAHGAHFSSAGIAVWRVGEGQSVTRVEAGSG